MAGDDELVRCAGCGELFTPRRGARGPQARYCPSGCRQAAHRERVHLETVTAAADLVLVSTHSRLVAALAALSPSSVRKLRDHLSQPSERNSSLGSRDELLCRSTTTGRPVLVSDLHKEG